MTDQEKRIFIAEKCGWTRTFYRDETKTHESPIDVWHGPDGAFDPLPDYLNDLNAMHEARKHLPLSSEGDYISALEDIVGLSIHTAEGGSYDGVYEIANTSARQQAEAFIQAIQ